jgi:hypothetical protein
MNDKVEHLLLEHLRAMRGDMTRLADDMRTMRSEMTALRQHIAGVVTLQEHDHGDIAALKVRLHRIENRLDLVE